jgi:exopolyphosphatase/guanosine-5'-triphosphate,3'-diphosphate pyrophosphatase
VGELRSSDLRIVREQLARDPGIPFTVVARCAPEGHPLVIRNRPIDATGAPFPTLFWLTCPGAVRAVSRLESTAAIGELNERVRSDPGFASALRAAHQAYASERARGHLGAEHFGGVGGTREGVKCLHAHYAHHLAGGEDPVGAWTAERVEPIHAERPDRVAAIDQGTNSTRLLVAEPDGKGGFVELARDMIITRLGKGVDEAGRISEEALERTLGVIGTFARRARALHATRIRVGATSAVRDASNRDAFERAVRELTGSDPEVIAGEREAALSFLGATRGLEEPGPFLVLDIGGGSTELVLGERDEEPSAAISTQMGSVRLTERLIAHDPPKPDELDRLRTEIGRHLDEAGEVIPVEGAGTLVAVAGTSTTIQAIALELPFYDPEAIHRTWLGRSEAASVLSRLSSMTTEERAALPVMAPGRADVIVAGALILVEVMERFGFDRALVSETDILDGLLLEWLQS